MCGGQNPFFIRPPMPFGMFGYPYGYGYGYGGYYGYGGMGGWRRPGWGRG